MSIYKRFFEMAKPNKDVKSSVYWHGTWKDEYGKSILQAGIKPPSVEFVNRRYREQPLLAPKPNMIYITSNIETALRDYTFNRRRLLVINSEEKASILKFQKAYNKKVWEFIKQDGVYGWLFQINGSQLHDVYPDEDLIGNILQSELSYGGHKYPWLVKLARSVFDADRLENIRYAGYGNGMPRGQLASAGKELMGRLTDKQVYQLLKDEQPETANLAHEGLIEPIHAWRVNKKDQAYIMDENCEERFFEVAEQVR